jgi:hypothetical protein
MSKPSFHLRKHANGRLYAVTRYVGMDGRSHELVKGTKTKDEAQAKAYAEKWLAEVNWKPEPPRPAPVVAPPPPPPSSPPPLPRRERAPERAAELVNRLRGITPPAAPPPLGDVPPPPPKDTPPVPELLAPGEKEKQQEKEKAEDLDMEAGELFGDMLAGALVGGHLRAVKNFAANQVPPRKAEEPNEVCLEWERAGVAKKCRRLFGKSGGLSENTKLLLGIAGVTLSMLWDAEIIEPKPAAAAAAAQPQRPAPQPVPKPAPAPPAPPAPAAQPARALAIVPTPAGDKDAAAGKF